MSGGQSLDQAEDWWGCKVHAAKCGFTIGSALLLAGSPALAGPSAVFTDEAFSALDWQVTAAMYGGGGTVSVMQHSTEGTPPPAWQVTQIAAAAPTPSSFSTIAGLHTNSAATYSPTAGGAVEALTFAVDFKNLDLTDDDCPAGGAGQRFGLGLSQGGQFFTTKSNFQGTSGTSQMWETKSSGALSALDLVLVDMLDESHVDTNVHPDFSATALPMTFGLYTSNSTVDGGSGFSRCVAYDNWIVTVTSSCGNSVIDAGETCDDGGTVSGDGCSVKCQIEAGWVCSGEPSACSAICGDGRVVGGEECDDGNVLDGDCCSSICLAELDGTACIGSACTISNSCMSGICKGEIPNPDIIYFDDFETTTYAYSLEAELAGQNGWTADPHPDSAQPMRVVQGSDLPTIVASGRFFPGVDGSSAPRRTLTRPLNPSGYSLIEFDAYAWSDVDPNTEQTHNARVGIHAIDGNEKVVDTLNWLAAYHSPCAPNLEVSKGTPSWVFQSSGDTCDHYEESLGGFDEATYARIEIDGCTGMSRGRVFRKSNHELLFQSPETPISPEQIMDFDILQIHAGYSEDVTLGAEFDNIRVTTTGPAVVSTIDDPRITALVVIGMMGVGVYFLRRARGQQSRAT